MLRPYTGKYWEMTYNPDIHHRQSTRLPHYDYAGVGGYSVTLCTRNRECLLGDVVDGAMRLNDFGVVVEDCWNAISQHFQHVALDACVVMPNHVHGILIINDDHSVVGVQHAAPLSAPLRGEPSTRSGMTPNNVIPGSLGAIIRSFKSAATRHINILRGTAGCPLWQRNYYEHVIRGDRDLVAIRQYIADNPAQWLKDANHPDKWAVGPL